MAFELEKTTYELVKVEEGAFGTSTIYSTIALSEDVQTLIEYAKNTLKVAISDNPVSWNFQGDPIYIIRESEVVILTPKVIELNVLTPDVIETNINNYVTFYPTEKGLEKMKELDAELFFNTDSTIQTKEDIKAKVWELMQKHITEDGGYRDQMWCIMNNYGDLFYNGTDKIMHSTIKIEKSC